VAEQNNELLMKNHESRATGAAPFPEVNVASHSQYGRGRGRSNDRGRGRDHNHIGNFKNNQKKKNDEKGNGGQNSKNNGNICYRCGGKIIGLVPVVRQST
jgi:hypothetical protein